MLGAATLIIIFSAIVLASICVYLIVRGQEMVDLIRRQQATIIRLKKPNFKDKKHQEQWNYLWYVIREKMNIVQREDGTWNGGQPAKEILKMLKTEFGKFNADQMHFITLLIVQIRKVLDEQREYEAAMNPIGKDIVFDKEGGFSIIDRAKPSNN